MKKFEKLSRAEMKNVMGGVAAPPNGGYTYSCTATSGSTTHSFSCDDCADTMISWANFWEADGYSVNCSTTEIYDA